jgi:hypothetical protein
MIRRKHLLIIDDFGLVPLDTQQRMDLMEVIEDRHGRAATITASQLPVAKWIDVIGDCCRNRIQPVVPACKHPQAATRTASVSRSFAALRGVHHLRSGERANCHVTPVPLNLRFLGPYRIPRQLDFGNPVPAPVEIHAFANAARQTQRSVSRLPSIS